MKLYFVTTCKGRSIHLRETLPRNMADNPLARFVVLDYGDGPDLKKVVKPLLCDRLNVYRYEAPVFRMAHAKNMAHRLAIREGADVLVMMDADNFAGRNFDQFVIDNLKERTFLAPDMERIQAMPWGKERPLRGFAGRLAVRAQDFIKAGGYNEVYDTWRGEDSDFNTRMLRMGFEMKPIDLCYLRTIPHTAEIRFKEYPHAQQFEVSGGWKLEEKSTDTVVNYGNIGVGTVHKYGDKTPIELKPVPTRLFGIGMHKTATNSLHKAFQILGFDSLHWGSGEAPLIWEEVHHAGRSKTLERFYAACDLPIPLLYRKLDKAYPGSKFILTIRDEDKWLKSVERLWDEKYNPTRWEWDVWPISNRLHKALYGRTDFHPETMLATYHRHNAEVKEYFKGRDDLLVMDMEQSGWDGLCTFLDRPVPSVPYPRIYITEERNRNLGSF